MPLEDRQGFLGPSFDTARRGFTIAIVGISGGGSHVVQQCAHAGFENFLLIDPQTIGPENLHRHVGATERDVAEEAAKVAIGDRVIRSVRKQAVVEPLQAEWQQHAPLLRAADVIIGCVDGVALRLQLETLARRYVIPYLDIGLRVFLAKDERPPRMVGHVFLSLPDEPCFRCLQLLTDRDLTEEAERYGAPGVDQQVVSANGVLASSAVGMLLDLVTGWCGGESPPTLLEYDGNKGELRTSPKLVHFRGPACGHFPAKGVGDPMGRDL